MTTQQEKNLLEALLKTGVEPPTKDMGFLPGTYEEKVANLLASLPEQPSEKKPRKYRSIDEPGEYPPAT